MGRRGQIKEEQRFGRSCSVTDHQHTETKHEESQRRRRRQRSSQRRNEVNEGERRESALAARQISIARRTAGALYSSFGLRLLRFFVVNSDIFVTSVARPSPRHAA